MGCAGGGKAAEEVAGREGGSQWEALVEDGSLVKRAYRAASKGSAMVGCMRYEVCGRWWRRRVDLLMLELRVVEVG